ncbi:MAG: RNA methyltransferase [Planctomycetota bacterium]
MTAVPRGPAGLSGLDGFLSGKKGALARRWVCAGEDPDPERFRRAGYTLTEGEAEDLRAWRSRGLSTRVERRIDSADGTARLVLRLRDDRIVETVAMPVGAVCVSSQVGCAVGCRFCASGMRGVERNLDAQEIVEQVIHARRLMRIDRVVFMGMGEPSHNLGAVLEAVSFLARNAHIGARRQTLSTVGSSRTFERMRAAAVPPALALSLHCADDERRRQILPRAHREPIAEIVAAADCYGRAIDNPVQFEWTLLAGFNDRDRDIDALIRLLDGANGYVNFIVWNPVEGLPFAAPPRERTVEIVRRVKRAGILATIRDSSGADAGAGCGQLRLRAIRELEFGGSKAL